MTFLDVFGGRKAGFSLVSLVVGVAVALMKGDIPANLLQLLQVLSTGYIIGNVGSKVVARVTQGNDEGSDEAPAPPDFTPRIEAVENSVKAIEKTTAMLAKIILETTTNVAPKV